MEPNPYLPPATISSEAQMPVPDAEYVRRQHLNHENSIKGVGGLLILGAIFVIPSSLFMGSQLLAGDKAGTSWGLTALMLVLGVIYLVVGLGLRKLKSWSRIPASIIAGLGLLAFPIGTLINALILSYLLSKKGGVVFSPGYKDIIAATPHVKARTSWVVWLLLIIALVVIVVGAIAIIAAR